MYGDKDKLTQVFLLILKNAIEASSEKHHPFISIDVVDQDDANVCIKVIDEGSGIAAENIDKVTEPFYTTKKHGVGIGLTICQQFVQEHHGSLSIHSEQGKGTTVEIILPLKEPCIKK